MDEKGMAGEETAAFGSLVVFEMEECGGPGMRGLLHTLRKFRESPSDENRGRLAKAISFLKGVRHYRKRHAKEIQEAEEMLKAR